MVPSSPNRLGYKREAPSIGPWRNDRRPVQRLDSATETASPNRNGRTTTAALPALLASGGRLARRLPLFRLRISRRRRTLSDEIVRSI